MDQASTGDLFLFFGHEPFGWAYIVLTRNHESSF